MAMEECWLGLLIVVSLLGLICRARPRTPAMALGLTDHRWSVAELLAQPLPVAAPDG